MSKDKKEKKKKDEITKEEKKKRLEKLQKARDAKSQRFIADQELLERISALKIRVVELEEELEKKEGFGEEEVHNVRKEAEEQEAKMQALRQEYEEKKGSELTEIPSDELKDLKERLEVATEKQQRLETETKSMKDEAGGIEEELIKLKESNAQLQEATESAASSLHTLDEQNALVEAQNNKIQKRIDKQKEENHRIEETVNVRQAYVDGETSVRTIYEDAMEEIVNLVEKKCPKHDIVEQVMVIQLQCHSKDDVE